MQDQAFLGAQRTRQCVGLRRNATEPLGVARRGVAHDQRRRHPLRRELPDEPPLDAPRVAQPLGFDQQAAIEVEELEEASVQAAHALQRVARVADLQHILVAARQHVDAGASATGEARQEYVIIHGQVRVRSSCSS